MIITECRYQYRGPKGIQWTQWFAVPTHAPRPKTQPGGLKYEYRETEINE